MTSTATSFATMPPQVRPNGFALRVRLTARGTAGAFAALAGVALLPLWATMVALSPLTLIAPLAVAVTWLVRRYAGAYRRGRGIASPYRDGSGGLLRRLIAIVRDPATWRDALWLLVKPIVGFTAGLVPFVFLLGAVFYLIYPFLYAVTPHVVFGHMFGFVTITSVAMSFAFVPLALVSLGIWWAVTVPMARVDAALDRALLS